MQKKKFNVLMWNFNNDELEYYDILPYFRECYRKQTANSKKHKDSEYWKVPTTHEEFKSFIKRESQYRYWSKCEYEMICHGWPVQKNDYKLDVHEQIMMNIDIIADILTEECKKD